MTLSLSSNFPVPTFVIPKKGPGVTVSYHSQDEPPGSSGCGNRSRVGPFRIRRSWPTKGRRQDLLPARLRGLVPSPCWDCRGSMLGVLPLSTPPSHRDSLSPGDSRLGVYLVAEGKQQLQQFLRSPCGGVCIRGKSSGAKERPALGVWLFLGRCLRKPPNGTGGHLEGGQQSWTSFRTGATQTCAMGSKNVC